MRLHASIPYFLLVFAGGYGASADVLLFEEPGPWWSATGPTESITFLEVPLGALVTDQYHLSHGVLFADGSDVTYACPLGCVDARGLNGLGDIIVEFDTPQSWIGSLHNGDITIELYSGDELMFTSDDTFWGSGYGLFSGVISSAPFDRVRLYDFFDGLVFIDDLNFGGPECGAGGVAESAVTCPGDATWDGLVNVDDLVELLLSWGPCPQYALCRSDFDFDCQTGVDDLLTVLTEWGPCQDCNGNDVRDEVDIAEETSLDCNGNGVPDECDVAQGSSPDCNGNGIPDECDAEHGYEVVSPYLSPIGVGSPQGWTFPSPPQATGNVHFIVSANGDMLSSSQYLLVSLNGYSLGLAGSFDCAPGEVTLALDTSTFNELVAAGDATVLIESTPWVDPYGCEESWVRVRLRYPTTELGDCNGNGVPDGCDIASGASLDLNGDGIPNECQGAPADCNADGMRDAAERFSDCNDNGRPDECDIAIGFEATSGQMSPVMEHVPLSLIAPDPPVPSGDVAIYLTAVVDISPATWLFQVFLNGTEVGRVFSGVVPSCPEEPDHDVVSISAERFVELVGSGGAVIDVEANGLNDCEGAYVVITLRYPTAELQDCNGNSVPDGCDIASGASEDGNGDGVPDECG